MPSAAPRDAHRNTQTTIARLVLEDGTVFVGQGFGAVGRGVVSVAEVVFNTALTGYQEALTDPSYTGQILVATFPMMGNYGINARDVESDRVQVAGFVVRELARRHSNFRATEDLSSYLARHGVLGLCEIDTRALTRRLRTGGVMRGALTDDARITDAQLLDRCRSAASMAGANLVPLVGCTSERRWSEDLGAWAVQPRTHAASDRPLRVVALDCGAKRNILRHLTQRGCEVRVVPHTISADELLAMRDRGELDGLFISNGPGDPAAVEAVIATLRTIFAQRERPIPTFGICLGHQLIALALGARTYKLPFGHRGTNQPVLDTRSGRVEITSQNHGFAVDRASLEAVGAVPTHTHLNDQTLAGFTVRDLPVLAVQYHPEASPGPSDSARLFDEFVDMVRRARDAAAAGVAR